MPNWPTSAPPPPSRVEPRRHGLGGPHELDVGVEGRSFLRAAPIVGGHGLNLNRFYAFTGGVVKAHCVLAIGTLGI